MNTLFDRHQRVAFHFSGGRDSTAALYLMRPYWDRMTVYHLDTCDQFPETAAVVQRVAQDVPLVRVVSDVPAFRATHGLPSDLTPADNTLLGRAVTANAVKIIGSYDCCTRARMLPMHERMMKDGITAIIRGQRGTDYEAPLAASGQVVAGVELCFPIHDWTAERVMAYLRAHDLPVAPFYERGLTTAPECFGCTGRMWERRLSYIAQHHPGEFQAVLKNVAIVRREALRQGEAMARELANAMAFAE